jgi:hypothetical protein
MGRRRRVYGVIHFPWAIPVENNCLNKSYRTRIADEQIIITFPALDECSKLTAPTTQEPRLPERILQTLEHGWGFALYTNSQRAYRIHGARVSFLLTTGIHAADSPEFTSFHNSFEKWFEIVRYWIGGWTGSLPDNLTNSPGVRIHIPNGPKHMRGTGITMPVYINFGEKAASPEQVASAFAYAGRGEHVPTENRLTMDAHQAIVVEDFRRSVIDSATATEVAMAGKVSKTLTKQGISDDAVSKIIVKANGLVGLFDLLVSVGHSLPVSKTQLTEKLAKVRNHTAHAGHTPSRNEASQAYSCARKIVVALCPLPTTPITR